MSEASTALNEAALERLAADLATANGPIWLKPEYISGPNLPPLAVAGWAICRTAFSQRVPPAPLPVARNAFLNYQQEYEAQAKAAVDAFIAANAGGRIAALRWAVARAPAKTRKWWQVWRREPIDV